MTDDVYWKAGNTLKTHFLVINGTTKVTGLVQGDFDIDIAKNGVGNQASTGVTITEVDASNNPGEYYYTVDGSTGYINTTGSFVATMTTTVGGTDLTFTDKRISTSDGSAGGSTGVALFESSDGDGRVTDGTNPVEGADVYFRNAAGDLVTQVVTDSSGDYMLYLDETVTAYAQKTNYSQATGQITVSGGVATGPGTNLEIISTAGTGTTTFGALVSYARKVSGDQTGNHADVILKEAVNDALMQVSNAHEWSYLSRSSNINVQAQYNTGTISITQGSKVVTGSGTVFPSWAANGQMIINDIFYNVASRDSDTQVTLAEDFGFDDLADGGYTLMRDSYPLPSDLIRTKAFHQGVRWRWGEQPISFDNLYRMKTQWKNSNSTAYNFAIAEGSLILYPWPSEDADINLTYQKRIGEYSDSASVIDFSEIHKHLLHRAIDYHIAVRFGNTAGESDSQGTFQAYKQALAEAIDADQKFDKYNPPDGQGRRRPNFYRRGGYA